MAKIHAIEYKLGALHLIDQRKLPTTYEIFVCTNHQEVIFAIKDMVVRGAPAIGATAAYGVALAAFEFQGFEAQLFYEKLDQACTDLYNARPTAVNLMWAVKRMRQVIANEKDKHKDSTSCSGEDVATALLEEAHQILKEDVETNKTMAAHGNTIIPEKATILTHCNTGALATAGYGTALGVVREAFYTGKDIFVYADETRPRLQGGKLTAWELVQEGIPAKLIADNTAATLIRDGKIDVILVGADRIASNGDTANKIGTFMLSVVAKHYHVPFYIVAPTTTIDFEMADGSLIEIEERDSEEVTHVNGVQITPDGIAVYNPAFDVTPHAFITGIITEKGILKPPFTTSIKNLMSEF